MGSDKTKYFIPSPITGRSEFAPGIGWPEAIKIAIIVVPVSILDMLLFFKTNTFMYILSQALTIAIPIGLFIKPGNNPGDMSIIELFKTVTNYFRNSHNKKYYYTCKEDLNEYFDDLVRRYQNLNKTNDKEGDSNG
jgi:hypothetical protein